MRVDLTHPVWKWYRDGLALKVLKHYAHTKTGDSQYFATGGILYDLKLCQLSLKTTE